MRFNPTLPAGGYAGWRFLTATLPRQQEAFAGDRTNRLAEADFRERIGRIGSAEALVSDRRLLDFALKAFGLGDDINNRAFIRKILESPTRDPGALANRLADHRYRDMARAFGFADPGGPRTTIKANVDRIVGRWRQEEFEAALGSTNPQMRIALNAQNEITRLAGQSGTADGRWFAVLGSAPLRSFMQTALGLPPAFATIDLDKQLQTLRGRMQTLLGESEIAQLTDPVRMEKLVRNFFLRSETAGSSAAGPQSGALALLNGAGRGLLLRL